MLFIWLSDRRNHPLVLWLVLSVIMICIPSFFWINDFIAHPQHGEFYCWETIAEIIQRPENFQNELWYRMFFIVDFFWAFLTLFLIGKFIYDRTHGENSSIWELFHFNRLDTVLKIYLVLAIITFILDVIEGVFYLTYYESIVKNIVDLKKTGYVICFIFFLYFLFRHFVYPNVRSVLRFIWASLFSILFVLIIYTLVIFLPQGATLVVHLFFSPLNIVMFFFQLIFLAILLSHFPVYMDIWNYDRNKNVTIRMDGKGVLGFGIIYYDTSGAKSNLEYSDGVSKALRRSIGIFLYTAVFNIMYVVISKFYEAHINPMISTLFVIAIALFVYYLEGKTYTYWMKELNRRNISRRRLEKVIGYVVGYVRWFPFYLGTTIFFTLLTAFVVSQWKWGKISVFLFMVTLSLHMFLYIMFKISRSLLKYVFISRHYYEKKPKIFHKLIYLRFCWYFKKYPQKRPSMLLNPFAKLSDNIFYIKLMRFSGLISLLVIGYANFNVDFATFLNPIVIIIFYIILFYSISTITFKHILYYSRSNSDRKFRSIFKYGIPVAIVVLIATAAYLSKKSNNLHELKIVESEKKKLPAIDYFNNVVDTNFVGKKNYFFVGSYGGGLKANLWNLLIFRELDKNYEKEFFPRTLVLSGVSGGAVGIGNYTSLMANSESIDDIDQQIHTIGMSNVLSNELVLLLGKDWLREYLPFDGEKHDRSYHSMKMHADHTYMKYYDSISYEDYWYRAYEKRNKKFPFLLMNSTSVGGSHGVATTIRFSENTFPSATMMNEFENNQESLTYYGAVSTTNRFPIFSPTAKIREKGSFLDGGYFENSGLLSAKQVYDAIAGDSTKAFYDNIQPIFINIINSKEIYIRQKLKEFEVEPTFRLDPSEYQSILETLLSTEKLPKYVSQKIRWDDFVVFLIMMPHKLYYEDIKRLLRGDVDDPITLMEQIRLHNDSIDKALIAYDKYHFDKWGVVEPPLARLLSKPAVRYQEAMVKKHQSIRSQIDGVMKGYIESEVPLDTVQQDNIKRYVDSVFTKVFVPMDRYLKNKRE